MAEGALRLGGQDFSLRSEKDRFVLPAKFRNPIVEATKERVVCIGLHEKWPCLIAFGTDFKQTFDAIIASEEARFGAGFDRDARLFQLWDFDEVPFDGSGRFVLPGTYAQVAEIGEQMYLQGMGDYITLWAPAVLLAQTQPVFRGAQAKCRAELARLAERGK